MGPFRTFLPSGELWKRNGGCNAPIIIRPELEILAAWESCVVELRSRFLKRFRLRKRQCNFDAFNEDFEVLNVAQILRINERFVVTIS